MAKKKIKEQKKQKKPVKFKLTNQITILIVLFLVFSAIVAGFLMFRTQQKIEFGDKVTITSKIYLENGTLISDSPAKYTFYVGDKTFADEIENAAITMKKGSTKKIFVDINTTKIYPMKIISIPQKIVFNSTYEIDISQMPDAKTDDIFILPGTNWNSTIVNITENKIIAKHMPKDMEDITYSYLGAVIPAKAINSKDGQRFNVIFNLVKGDILNIYYNEYVVKSASNIAVTLHLNRLLSGETLVQEITLADIEKKNK